MATVHLKVALPMTGMRIGKLVRTAMVACHRLMGVALPALLQLAGLVGFAGQAQADEAPAESRSQAFQAVEGAVQEDIAGGPLLLMTYAIIWIVLFLYVVRLVRLQRRTQVDLDGLRAALRQDGASGE